MENNEDQGGSPTFLFPNIKKTIHMLTLSEKHLSKLNESLSLNDRLVSESQKAIFESRMLLHTPNSFTAPHSLADNVEDDTTYDQSERKGQGFL